MSPVLPYSLLEYFSTAYADIILKEMDCLSLFRSLLKIGHVERDFEGIRSEYNQGLFLKEQLIIAVQSIRFIKARAM